MKHRCFLPVYRALLVGTLGPIGTMGAAALCSTRAQAESWVEKREHIEINWSTLVVKFYGDSVTTAEETDSYKGAERRAWQDGYETLLNDLGELTAARGNSSANGIKVAAAGQSITTTFFGDGKVRVFLQSPLAKVLQVPEGTFKGSSPATASTSSNAATGVVLKVSKLKTTNPMASYKVVNQSGSKLFSIEDMTASAFNENMMGRWYIRPTASELASVVGEAPITLDAVVDSTLGTISVDAEAWASNSLIIKSFFNSGKVIIAAK